MYEVQHANRSFVIFEVEPASHRPVAFQTTEWIRVGTYKKPLRKHPEKEKVLWHLFARESFETGKSILSASADEVLQLLSYPDFFALSGQPLPETKSGILATLEEEKIITREDGRYAITNLGAICFARDLHLFDTLERKIVRVIFYRGADRIQSTPEHESTKGYAVGFSGLVGFIKQSLPRSEDIRNAMRVEVPVFPEIAIRELVANALIHQDFNVTGAGPMIAVFRDRMEITNPGTPLIDIQRLLGLPPRSRNEKMAMMMRRMKICEEQGRGIERALRSIEVYQLPPPEFEVAGDHMRVILFAPKKFRDMTKTERIRACYQHAGLQWMSNKQLTNESLRKRFGLSPSQHAVASRVINETSAMNLIRPHDPSSTSRRHARYVPYWA